MKKSSTIWGVPTLLALFAVQAQAQPLVVATDAGSGNVIYGHNTGTQQADGVGVYGESTPQPNWGIGVIGAGGYIGMKGYASGSGTGSRYGGIFDGKSGTGDNYGVWASAYGPANSTNYGIYASAGGDSSSTNYAGYFVGDVFVSGTIVSGHVKVIRSRTLESDPPGGRRES